MTQPKYLTSDSKSEADLDLQLKIVEHYLPRMLIKFNRGAQRKEVKTSVGKIKDWISL